MKKEDNKLMEKIKEIVLANKPYRAEAVYNLVIANRKHRREELLKHLPNQREIGDMLDENTDEGHTSLDGVSRSLKDFVEMVLDNIDYEEHK